MPSLSQDRESGAESLPANAVMVSAEVYGEWLRRQGFRVIRTSSSFWHSEGLGIYHAFPYHVLLQPSGEEISTLFRSERARVLRYFASAEASAGSPSYHIVYNGPEYRLEDLGHRTRKNVRRGLKSCACMPISFERLAEEGWTTHQDTLVRQGRNLKQSQEDWRRRFLAADKLPGFDAWGAFVDGRLAAYMVSFQFGDCGYIVDQKSDRQFLDLNVNNAITYTVSQTLLSRPGVRSILYAVHSLDAPDSVAEFKYHMGYVQKPVRQCVMLHPYMSPFVNGFTHLLVRGLSRCVPANRKLSKAEGLMRVYREQFASGR